MKDEMINRIADKLSNEIDSVDNELLKKWIRESDQNKKIYNSYVRLFSDIKNLKNKNLKIDSDLHFDLVKERIIKKQKRRILFQRVIYAAAAVLLPAIIFITILFNTNTTSVDLPVQIAEINPGVKKAQLVLSTGERVELSDTIFDVMHQQEGVEMSNRDSKLNYSSSEGKSPKEIKYNTLIVGRGEEYELELTDGTKVWLNSESVLKYPVHFSAKNRRVELKGEAYFEVAHNAKKPFLVNTHEMNIEVLGTSFNVSAYADDESVHATLLEGKVKVHNNVGDIKEKILQPNQQFIYNKIENQVAVNQVNAGFYSAWKDGAFTFDDEPLTTIMRKLERWYDIRVFFQGQNVQNLRFSGKLTRFKTCNDVLYIISKTTHIDFEIKNDRTVLIKQKNK